MLDRTLSLKDLTSELDETVLDAEEFIWRFKDLASRIDLPHSDESLQTLEATESLIPSYQDIARRVAQDVREGSISPEEESVLLALIAWATRQIRRATLLLKRQVFRLDDILWKGLETA